MSARKNTWLVTYCDMVTLLMAFFLCVLALSSAVLSHQLGDPKRDSVVWRPCLRPAASADAADALAPLYRQPSRETSDRILQALENAAAAPLADNFAIGLPLDLLFDEDEQLSPSGRHLLHALAVNLHGMPWDLRFQVSDVADAPRAVQLCHFLLSEESWEPARLAVAAQPRPDGRDHVWLVLLRQE
jgi:hypothetical protein